MNYTQFQEGMQYQKEKLSFERIPYDVSQEKKMITTKGINLIQCDKAT